MSIPSELGHLAMPTNFLAQGKNQMAQASFVHEFFRSLVLRFAAAPHWLGTTPIKCKNVYPVLPQGEKTAVQAAV